MNHLPHLGWSSCVYPLEVGDVANLPDYVGTPIPVEALPTDAVQIFMRPDAPDVLVRGRAEVTKAIACGPQTVVLVRIVFYPTVPKWNICATCMRFLRMRYRYRNQTTYHIDVRDVRALGLERTIRTLDNPQKRTGKNRVADMERLAASLKTKGFDDTRPLSVMLCRTGGASDSLRQGHHRVSACIGFGIFRVAIRFDAAGALPLAWRPQDDRQAEDLRCFLNNETDLNVISLSRISVRSRSPNYKACCAGGKQLLVKVASARVRLQKVNDPLAVRDLFPDRTLTFGNRRVFCLDWKHGISISPDKLSDAAWDNLMTAYVHFQHALPPSSIHGDFNFHNVLFEGDAVSGILDLEAVRTGHPCEDWVRFLLTGVEHLPVFAVRRRVRIVRRFIRLVEKLPFNTQDWRRAIDAFAEAKYARKMKHGSIPFVAYINLAWRQSFYRCLIRKMETYKK